MRKILRLEVPVMAAVNAEPQTILFIVFIEK